MTRLCIILAALALIGRARVTVLPGWVVPLPVLLIAAALTVAAAVAAWVVLHPLPAWAAPELAMPRGEAGS